MARSPAGSPPGRWVWVASGRLEGDRVPFLRPAPLADRGRAGRVARSVQDAYAAWAADMSGLTGVPERALEAYAAASRRVAVASPECHLDWTSLASIGEVESGNGADGGGFVADGRPGPRSTVRVSTDRALAGVPDSDGGRIDGDRTLDRVVGPLQFLPSTWRTWGTDGDGDGVVDAQDVDDAALSAARYLCATGDLGTATGWTAAVFSYNHSAAYVQAVYSASTRIAAASHG